MVERVPGFVHRLALGAPALLEAAFAAERLVRRRTIDAMRVDRPVFVAGLAGAGGLAGLLDRGGGFVSAAWPDPGADDPGALEEVFWRIREGERYLGEAGLVPVAPGAASIAAFGDFVRLVLLHRGGGRYLSGNGNNVLRLGALCEAFPDALLIHPFRDPLQQALDLLARHRAAAALARQDPSRRRLALWLGQHAFGADQRPFLFRGAPGPDEDPGHVDYWLKAWNSVHCALLFPFHEVREHQVFVDWDALCLGAAEYAPQLAALTGGALDPAALAALAAPPPQAADPDPELLERAAETHAHLHERFRTRFG